MVLVATAVVSLAVVATAALMRMAIVATAVLVRPAVGKVVVGKTEVAAAAARAVDGKEVTVGVGLVGARTGTERAVAARVTVAWVAGTSVAETRAGTRLVLLAAETRGGAMGEAAKVTVANSGCRLEPVVMVAV